MIEILPSRAIALSIAGFPIHWYGIMYLLGFLITAFLLPRLQRYRGMHEHKDDWLNLVTWAVVGVIAGGRLGYVLFYQPAYYLRNPLEILYVWEGGMSFHGGLIGVSTLLFLYCRKRGWNIRTVGDIVVVPVAIGLALGRLGNFINLELYGSVTSLPWAIAIPGVEGLRHPTQLYAMGKDLLIAAVCFLYLVRTWQRGQWLDGRAAALFLMLYGVGRFLNEFLRVQTASPLIIGPLELTRGQLLTIPVFIAGVAVWFWSRQLTAVPARESA